jgi:hypothetical protein
MLVPAFLVAGGGQAWLCDSLEPIEQRARFADAIGVPRSLTRFPSRPGALWAYMETCEIDCDIEDGVVTTVRELILVRGTARHQVI